MPDKREIASEKVQLESWDASDQSLLSAMLVATPAQRPAWLEEVLQLAYATGALRSSQFISKEEWDAMGSLKP